MEESKELMVMTSFMVIIVIMQFMGLMVMITSKEKVAMTPFMAEMETMRFMVMRVMI